MLFLQALEADFFHECLPQISREIKETLTKRVSVYDMAVEDVSIVSPRHEISVLGMVAHVSCTDFSHLLSGNGQVH